MLVYKQLSEGEDPKEVMLNEVDIWVQVYDIPKGLISETMLQSVGSYIRNFVKADPTNLNGTWKSYKYIGSKEVLKPCVLG